MKWLFLRAFGALTPQILSDFDEIFTKGSIQGEKTFVLRISEKFNFFGNGRYPKFALLVQLWPPPPPPPRPHPVSPWRWPKSEKNKYLLKKIFTVGLSKNRKINLLLPFQEKYNYFLPYLGYFWLEAGQDQRPKSQKQNLK